MNTVNTTQHHLRADNMIENSTSAKCNAIKYKIKETKWWKRSTTKDKRNKVVKTFDY